MGRYIEAGQITSILPAFISTAGMTPGEIEFFIETREDEIDARLGRYYNIAVWSGSAPPMIKTLGKNGTVADIIQSKVSMEDPSVSQWASAYGNKFESLITSLVSGTADLVTNSGTIIARSTPKSATFWSSTKGYMPTRNILDPTEQRVSPTRIQDTRDDLDADTV